jgi:amidophosphoribosyltransferase
MNVKFNEVQELENGEAIIIKNDGRVSVDQIRPKGDKRPCSFERIYFSRGSDKDIYRERKKLGELLTQDIVKSIDGDFEHTVFSYIPNTAESAYYGMVRGVEKYMVEEEKQKILD